MCAELPAAMIPRMTSGRGARTALHLFLVWATTAAAVPVLGFELFATAWGGGPGAVVPVFALGVPLVVVLLATAGIQAKSLVPLCESVGQRLGWAVLVFVLGTAGVLAGLAAYSGDVDLGSAEARFALVGVPYAVAAAFFVPSRWVRLGGVAALAAGVAYGGFLGPERADQRQHEAEIARYKEHSELLYAGTAPAGMHVSRVWFGPGSFSIEYHPVREGYELGYVGLTARTPLTRTPRCPEVAQKDATCSVDAHGVMRMIQRLPGGIRDITLVRRHHDAEIQVQSQTLGEAGLRHLLSTLHPLSDEELETMMREKVIVQS